MRKACLILSATAMSLSACAPLTQEECGPTIEIAESKHGNDFILSETIVGDCPVTPKREREEREDDPIRPEPRPKPEPKKECTGDCEEPRPEPKCIDNCGR